MSPSYILNGSPSCHNPTGNHFYGVFLTQTAAQLRINRILAYLRLLYIILLRRIHRYMNTHLINVFNKDPNLSTSVVHGVINTQMTFIYKIP